MSIEIRLKKNLVSPKPYKKSKPSAGGGAGKNSGKLHCRNHNRLRNPSKTHPI